MQTHSSLIKQLSNKELLSQTKFLVQKERNLHIQILHHLKEIDSRKLYLKMGFSSLFDYTVRELGYSEGAAYRRIKAMKLCQELPETENRLQSGRLSLSAACQLQTFFEKQVKKAKEENLRVSEKSKNQTENKNKELSWKGQSQESLNGRSDTESVFKVSQSSVAASPKPSNPKALSQEEKQNLIKRAEGCSTRATAKLLSETDPSLSFSREQTRFLGKEKVEIKITIEESCYKKLEELKNLLSHKNPNFSYGELLSILSDEALKKHDPCRKKVRQNRLKTHLAEQTTILSRKSAVLMEKSISVIRKPVTSAPKSASPTRKSVALPEQLISDKEKSVTLVEKSVSPTRKSVTSAEKLISDKGKTATSAPKSAFSASQRRKNKIITRAIPSYLRKYIWQRDKGQCAYIHHETKRRCSARHLLQIDHIRPFALGGESEKENLRLLCAGHNRYRK